MIVNALGRSVASRAGLRLAQRSFYSRAMPTAALSSSSKQTFVAPPVPTALISRSTSSENIIPQIQLPQLLNKNEELAKEILAAKKVSEQGLVFEFSFTWVLKQYQDLLIGFARNLFQTTRPLLILFVMGQILKGAFFAMGAPMLLSFYSIWMFEVFYGIGQCVISFIFVNLFYNNMSYLGSKTSAGVMAKSQHYIALYTLMWIILGYVGAAIPSDMCMCAGQTALVVICFPFLYYMS